MSLEKCCDHSSRDVLSLCHLKLDHYVPGDTLTLDNMSLWQLIRLWYTHTPQDKVKQMTASVKITDFS
jgi:hypothetical protein